MLLGTPEGISACSKINALKIYLIFPWNLFIYSNICSCIQIFKNYLSTSNRNIDIELKILGSTFYLNYQIRECIYKVLFIACFFPNVQFLHQQFFFYSPLERCWKNLILLCYQQLLPITNHQSKWEALWLSMLYIIVSLLAVP